VKRNQTHQRRSDNGVQETGPKLSHRPGDVLLVIDAINDLDFPGGERLLPWATTAARRLVHFRAAAHRVEMPVVYVNDNYGYWDGNAERIIEHCVRAGSLGRQISRALKPTHQDNFVLKPKHSGFFETSLRPLLSDLDARRLVLSGFATAADI
jgi:nicotinamidase-related amidase